MNKPLHIGISSINYDASPEGICTGRLIRALLNYGFGVTLLTSKKARVDFEHPQLRVIVYAHRPREPRPLFRLWARAIGIFPNNFFIWGQRALKHEFGDDVPDVFYGRAWPYGSLIPAYYFSQRLAVPFIAHLSDPIPPPNETYKGKASIANLQTMLDHASAVTMTNPESVQYQQRFTPMQADKVHVLPHVSPGMHQLPDAEQDVQRYYYIGAVGDNRKPSVAKVFAGFAQHLQRCAGASMHFVGSNPQDIQPDIERLSLQDNIEVLGFVKDIKPMMTRATALFAFEPEVENPVWTPTKLMEYLCANRCIFSLTCEGSPAQRMLSPFPESCVVVTDHRVEAIAEGFDRLAGLNPTPGHFAKRLAAMAEYKADHVAEQFAGICRQVLASSD